MCYLKYHIINFIAKKKKEGEIKTWSDKQKLMKFVVSRPALQEVLKEDLQWEGNWYRSETQIYIKKERTL